MKIAVIADRGVAPRFWIEALDALEGCEEVALFSCTNGVAQKRPLRHAAYYALNLFTIRNAWSRGVPLASSRKRIARTVEFESVLDGAWQRLPDPIVAELREGGFDLILKMGGMGLMRVPPPEALATPILSYHHGDPSAYRGRPAGFWEMVRGEKLMGQMVQVIGNTLDAGRIVAYAETKILPWSYRATLIECYRHSPLLINQAARNALEGRALPKPCTGKNWRLPSNGRVAAFVAKAMARFARRLVYGAFFEKKWSVSRAPDQGAEPSRLVTGQAFPEPGKWETLRTPPGYVFYADPFFSADPRGILVEALKKTSGIGEIILVQGDDHRSVSSEAGHMSYPATFEAAGRQLVIPEIAAWSSPKIFVLEEGRLIETGPLRLDERANLLDPTLIEHEGRVYLFANIRPVGSNTLFLWSAQSIDGPFLRHPMSPIRISPAGSRMAGSLIRSEDGLIRLGQDFRSDYGDGLLAFRIEKLSAEEYRETPIGGLRFSDRRGPHTLNVQDGEILFDWYRDGFSPLAGLRRLIARQD